MMIFNKFPSLDKADDFAHRVESDEWLKDSFEAIVCVNREEFDKHESYPYEVTFPAVLVTRSDSIDAEKEVEELVAEYGGEFSGT